MRWCGGIVNDLGAFKHETDVSNKYEFLKNLYKDTSMLSEYRVLFTGSTGFQRFVTQKSVVNHCPPSNE